MEGYAGLGISSVGNYCAIGGTQANLYWQLLKRLQWENAFSVTPRSLTHEAEFFKGKACDEIEKAIDETVPWHLSEFSKCIVESWSLF